MIIYLIIVQGKFVTSTPLPKIAPNAHYHENLPGGGNRELENTITRQPYKATNKSNSKLFLKSTSSNTNKVSSFQKADIFFNNYKYKLITYYIVDFHPKFYI